jgi:hypothetical protein
MKRSALLVLPIVTALSDLNAVLQAEEPYTQSVEILGITIKAQAKVSPRALASAKQNVQHMLKDQPDLAARMAMKHASVAIIPQNKFITTLPEFAGMSGRNDSNGNAYDSFKVRGAGGVNGQPVTAVSEENLIRQANDPFKAEDIFYHEFGHAIMNLGFSDSQRLEWMQIYDRAKQKNFFRGAFAMTNADEYWAELTQSFFGVNNEINGAETVRRTDPEAFEFLKTIYGPPSRSRAR